MTNPAIIEAAARLILDPNDPTAWDRIEDWVDPPDVGAEREDYLDTARAVLAAVTPMIEAAALERAAILQEALTECSDDLAEMVDNFYRREEGRIHPAEQRRYDRDMEPVLRARALLGREKQPAKWRTDCNMGYVRHGACLICGADATGDCRMRSA